MQKLEDETTRQYNTDADRAAEVYVIGLQAASFLPLLFKAAESHHIPSCWPWNILLQLINLNSWYYHIFFHAYWQFWNLSKSKFTRYSILYANVIPCIVKYMFKIWLVKIVFGKLLFHHSWRDYWQKDDSAIFNVCNI